MTCKQVFHILILICLIHVIICLENEAEDINEAEDWNTAILRLQNALKENPQNKNYRIGLIEVLLKTGRTIEATEEMGDLHATELHALGYKLANKEGSRCEEALLCYTEAINKDGENAEYYRSRGICHKALGNFDEAISDLRRSLKISKLLSTHGSTTTWILLGEVLMKAGHYNDAKIAFRKLMHSHPNLSESQKQRVLAGLYLTKKLEFANQSTANQRKINLNE